MPPDDALPRSSRMSASSWHRARTRHHPAAHGHRAVRPAPQRRRVYWVHLGWVLFMLVSLSHFWWWEFWLYAIRKSRTRSPVLIA